jgi:hypothetical protein
MKVQVRRYTDGAATRLIINTGLEGEFSSFLLQRRREDDQYFSLTPSGLKSGENWLQITEGWHGKDDGKFRFSIANQLASFIDPGPVRLTVKGAGEPVSSDIFVWPASPEKASLADQPVLATKGLDTGDKPPKEPVEPDEEATAPPWLKYILAALMFLLIALLLALYFSCRILPDSTFLRSCPIGAGDIPLHEETKDDPKTDDDEDSEQHVEPDPAPLPDGENIKEEEVARPDEPDDLVWAAGRLPVSRVTDLADIEAALKALHLRGTAGARDVLLLDGDFASFGSQENWRGRRDELTGKFGDIFDGDMLALLLQTSIGVHFALDYDDWNKSSLVLSKGLTLRSSGEGVVAKTEGAPSCSELTGGDVILGTPTSAQKFEHPYHVLPALIAALSLSDEAIEFDILRDGAAMSIRCSVSDLITSN